MRPDDADLGYVWDMLDAAEEAVSFVEGYEFKSYAGNHMLVRAVERCIQIIGEAANKVSSEFRLKHPEIPWQKIVAQRHVLVHDYGEIDQARIWNLLRDQIPSLIRDLRPIVESNPP